MHPRHPLAAVLALATLVLAGCGGGGGGGSTQATGPVASLSPGSLSFPMQPLTTASAPKTVTLQNTGNAVLTLASSPISITGTNAADYSFTTDCGASVAVGASCSINVTFSPGAGGSRAGTLNVASNAAGSPATVAITGVASDNALPVTVDMGPTPSTPTANILYADVKFCTPGTTTCAVVHHIQVDTGSFGLRVFKTALDAASGSSVVPTPAIVAGTSDAAFECVQYADGYTFGSVSLVDVQIGSRILHNVRIQLTGANSPDGVIPSDCAVGTNENQVSSFGANGILGIGEFISDCGPGCDTAPAPTAHYYQCPVGGSCTAVRMAEASQVSNPVAAMATDNNGVLISLPAVTGKGALTTNGFVYFGVNTQSDNMLGTAKWFGLDPSTGWLSTVYASRTFAKSIIDSGSNAYFFDSSTLPLCTNTHDNWAYCPTSGGVAASSSQSAVINGATTPATATINFTIDNTDTLFTTYGNDAVYPNLGGSASGVSGLFGETFDWGLPFFYGRPVFVLFETKVDGAVTGPAVAF